MYFNSETIVPSGQKLSNYVPANEKIIFELFFSYISCTYQLIPKTNNGSNPIKKYILKILDYSLIH